MLKKISVILLLISSIFIFCLAIYWQYFIQTNINVPDVGIIYDLRPASNLRQVANELQEKNIIRSAWLFEALARSKLKKIDQHIKIGEYQLLPNMTPGNVLDLFYKGKVYQRLFMIRVGETSSELLNDLSKNKTIQHQLNYHNELSILEQLNIKKYNSLEGLFMPDTYHYVKGASDLNLLKRANNSLTKQLRQYWKKRDKNVPYKTSYQALIMASIIEKEAATMLDRQKVSSVFANRIKLGMKLQADPTVIYALGDNYTGRLTKSQLKTLSPYNMYLHYGLPPTPIAMVSSDALYATLHPQWSKALYFVADGKGEHVFSDTLEQHNKAVKQYRMR